MAEETKYRVEEPTEDDDEPKGFLRPLPESKSKKTRRDGQLSPIVTLFGFEMRESVRDIIVVLLTPFIAGLVDATLYALVIVDALPEDTIYMFVLPAVAAIPIGLTIAQAGRAILGGFLTVVFFAVFLLLFLATPAIFSPEIEVLDLMFAGAVLVAVYSLFIIIASQLGNLLGIILREFF
ncbi:MAG: hypothetical protein RTU92_11340 [Candidatus Thorarchaeota archaeon]